MQAGLKGLVALAHIQVGLDLHSCYVSRVPIHAFQIFVTHADEQICYAVYMKSNIALSTATAAPALRSTRDRDEFVSKAAQIFDSAHIGSVYDSLRIDGS